MRGTGMREAGPREAYMLEAAMRVSLSRANELAVGRVAPEIAFCGLEFHKLILAETILTILLSIIFSIFFISNVILAISLRSTFARFNILVVSSSLSFMAFSICAFLSISLFLKLDCWLSMLYIYNMDNSGCIFYKLLTFKCLIIFAVLVLREYGFIFVSVLFVFFLLIIFLFSNIYMEFTTPINDVYIIIDDTDKPGYK